MRGRRRERATDACRNASRTVIGVAPLRLDAADRQHRFASDVDEIRSQSEGEQRRFWESELPGAREDDSLIHALRREDLLHAAEPTLNGRAT